MNDDINHEREPTEGNPRHSGRRLRSSRSSRSNSHSRKNGSRRHETIGERINRQFLIAGGFCIFIILIAAAYLLGRQQGIAKTEKSKPALLSTSTEAEAISTASASLPTLDHEQLAALTKAIELLKNGDLAASAAAIEALQREEPTSAALDLLLAKIRFAEGNVLASTMLMEAIADKPKPIDPSYLEVEVALWLADGDDRRALSALDEALEQNPASWQIRLFKAETLRKTGKLVEGFVLMREAFLFADSEPVSATLRLKQLLAGVEAQDQPTLELINQGLKQVPDAAHWQIAAAAVALSHGEKPLAVALLRSAKNCLDADLYHYFISDTVFDLHRLDSSLSEWIGKSQ